MSSKQSKQQRPVQQQRKRAPNPQVQRMKDVEGEKIAYRSVRNQTRPFRKLQRDDASIRILSSLTLPKESEPVRVGSAYGSDPTATGKLFRRLNAIWPFPTTHISDLPTTDTAAFFFRDALRAMVYNFGLAATDSTTYSGEFTINYSNSPSTAYPRYISPLEIDLTSSTVAPHGEFLYPGRNGKSDPLRGFLCQQNSTITVALSPVAGLIGGTNIIVTIMKFEADTWVKQTTFKGLPTDSPYYLFNVPVTGYYGFEVNVDVFGSNITATSTGYFETTTTGAGNASMWAQLPLPNIEDVLSVVRAYRVTSVSGMLTNTASPLNRQGQITGIQLPKESNFLDFLDFDDLASLMKAETFNVVNGMYGFLKPTSEDDFEMETFQYTANTSDAVVDLVFNLLPESDYLSIHAQVTTTAGQQAYWTPAYNVEYESVSQWSELRVSDANDNDLIRALAFLPMIPQWHENDFHFSDIWDWVKDAASSVWSGVKDVASVVGPIAGVAGLLL
jgi:hypothetical protein